MMPSQDQVAENLKDTYSKEELATMLAETFFEKAELERQLESSWAQECREKAARAKQSVEGWAIGEIDEGEEGVFVELYPDNTFTIGQKVYTHPPKAQGLPEGWTLKKVVDDMTTINITRDSDGAWCGGGIKEDSGANGLRYEFLEALLTATTRQADPDLGGDHA